MQRLDRYKQRICDALEHDKASFQNEAEAIVEAYKKQDRSDPEVVLRDHSYDEMEKAYQLHLKKWTNVQTELLDRKLDILDESARFNKEANQANQVKTLVDKMRSIQKIYGICEITAPVVFAAASILLIVLR
jgi:hypothetical protein